MVEVKEIDPFDDALMGDPIEELGRDSLALIRPPPGRAPHGLGPEYADRRAIVKMVEAHEGYRSRLRGSISEYRGTRRDAGFISYAQMRIPELDTAITTALEVANWPGGVWDFKRETIKEIFDHVAWLTRSDG